METFSFPPALLSRSPSRTAGALFFCSEPEMMMAANIKIQLISINQGFRKLWMSISPPGYAKRWYRRRPPSVWPVEWRLVLAGKSLAQGRLWHRHRRERSIATGFNKSVPGHNGSDIGASGKLPAYRRSAVTAPAKRRRSDPNLQKVNSVASWGISFIR